MELVPRRDPGTKVCSLVVNEGFDGTWSFTTEIL